MKIDSSSDYFVIKLQTDSAFLKLLTKEHLYCLKSHGYLKMKVLFYVLFLVISVSCLEYTSRVDPLVLIGQGLVRGTKSSDGSYSSFLGVPYAQVDLNNPFGVSFYFYFI